MDDRETSLSLARARLYTICLEERPVLVVSVGLEPFLDDQPADDAPLLLTELYAEQFDEIVDSPMILKLWDGDPDTLHVRKSDRRRSRSLVCLVPGQRERDIPDRKR